MSGGVATTPNQTMEIAEEGELEDGEIEDETGSENMADHWDNFGSVGRHGRTTTSTSKTMTIPSLMSMSVAKQALHFHGNSSFKYSQHNSQYQPGSSTFALENFDMAPRKRSLDTRESRPMISERKSTGLKRRKDSDSVKSVIIEKKTSSTKQSTSRRLNRKHKRSRRFQHEQTQQKDDDVSTDQDNYETLLRKHHEIQELIKQEQEKQTLEEKNSDKKKNDAESGEVSKPKRTNSQNQSSKVFPVSRSQGQSESMKEKAEGTLTDPETDVEMTEVRTQPEIIEIIDDDDEDDDELLHLRRMALESATKNVTAREEKENQILKEKSEKPTGHSESKQAKQKERRQKVKQLFHGQSIAAEIFKVHGEKERFAKFMDIIASRHGKALTSTGKHLRRSPSIGKDQSKARQTSPSGDIIPKEFQFDNYEEVAMDVSEMEESPALTPPTDTKSDPPQNTSQSMTGSDSDGPNVMNVSHQKKSSPVDDDEKIDQENETADDDDDDDVMALREQLLRSLATKRAAKAQAQEQMETQAEEYMPDEPPIQGPTYKPSPILPYSPRISPRSSPLHEDHPFPSSPKLSSSPLSTPRTQSPQSSSSQGCVVKPAVRKAKPKVPLPAIPTHKPVVIQFGGDSDSSDDDQSPRKPEMQPISFLDQFLKEARRTADAKKSQSPNPPPSSSHYPKTPDAMRKLPEVHRAEYQKLKEEIARRELQKLGKTGPAGGTGPGTRSPIAGVTVSITKVGGKRTVILKDLKGLEKSQEVKSDTPPPPAQESEQVLQCRGDLTKHRLTAEKDCRILLALDRQIHKRNVILKQLEFKLQQLRDELAVGERIATSHRSQIKKYIQQKHLVGRKVKEHIATESQLRQSVAKAKGVAVKNISQSQMLLEAAVKLPKTAALIGGRQKLSPATYSPMSKKPETELERLQRLEKEYASQISRLRQASTKPGPARNNPPPGAVVRILKTKTKLLNQKPSTQLLTKDKIVLGHDTPTNTDSESDAEKFIRSRKGNDAKRRRSFLDENPSLKPNLNAKPAISQSAGFSAIVHKSTSQNPSIGKSPTAGYRKSDFKQLTASSEKPKSSTETEKNAQQAESSASKPLPKTRTFMEGLSIPSDEQVERLRRAHAEKSKMAISASLQGLHLGQDSELECWGRRAEELNLSIIEDTKMHNDMEEMDTSTFMPYTSPLLCFRSYRLSPFFVKEAGLSRLSVSFSHKMDPMKTLCRFELNGTCNDDECPWQHQKDYEMSDHGIYADILAYTPLIAASREWQDATKREQRVTDYINKAVKKSKRPEAAKKQRVALCRAFANAVLTQTKKVSAGTIISQPRSWTPRHTPTGSLYPLEDNTDSPMVPRGPKATSGPYGVPLGGEDQERYYNEDGIANLEAAVLERPVDVQMWVRLAARLVGSDSENPDIDRGLNALSRGLEANQTSCELWLQYLVLYSQREDHGDLSELGQQALQFAPSYEIYWQCLGFEANFPAKDNICDKMLIFLQSQQASEATSQGSHRLLQALLYRVQLHIMTRRVKTATTLLQGSVQGPSTLSQHLTPSDRCFLRMMYIHILAYHQLPSHVFESTGSGLGYIVSKKPLIFQWGAPAAVQSAEGIRVAFQEALKECTSPDTTVDDNIKVCMPLHRNLAIFEQLMGRHEQSLAICQKLVDDCPENQDLWLLLIDVHRHNGSDNANLIQVVKKALVSCPRSVVLHYTAAKLELSSDTKQATEMLKHCTLAFYDVQYKDTSYDVEEMRRLYCSLLKQSLPFDCTPPKLHPGITSDMIESQSCYLWLSYCLLHELTSEDNVACDAYERSLCQLEKTEDARRVWMEYLLFQKSKMTANLDKTETFRTFTGLVNRCLASMATEFPVPHSDGKTWLDYSFHNRVVELYIGCLKDDECLDTYERFIDRMPSNIPLALRACQYAGKSLQNRASLHRVQVIASDVLNKFPECLAVWKILIALSLHQRRLKEAKMLYQQALEAVPLAANLWKDFFLLEVVHDRQPDDIKNLVLKCRELKVNIEDYLKTILK